MKAMKKKMAMKKAKKTAKVQKVVKKAKKAVKIKQSGGLPPSMKQGQMTGAMGGEY